MQTCKAPKYWERCLSTFTRSITYVNAETWVLLVVILYNMLDHTFTCNKVM